MSEPGFRFSRTDGVVLAVGGLATIGLLLRVDPGGRPGIHEVLLLPVVLLHFFLFCNVFRVRRMLELAWAAVFLANATVWMLSAEGLAIGPVLLVQAPVTLLVVGIEIRSERYHGVGARRGRTRRADDLRVKPIARRRTSP